MARFGFCGPTYQSSSVNADCQRCVNLFPEINESGQGNSGMILLSSPGLKIFATLPEKPVRGQLYFNGREFVVGGSRFCEVLAGGNVLDIGSVGNDGLPVSMAANQAHQLLIASAGTLYLYDVAAQVLSQPVGAPADIVLVGFSDGFFIALTRDSNIFKLSNLLDGATWNGLNVGEISVFPDDLVSMIVDHREIALLGSKQSVIYYDSGNTFPYDVVPGGFIEQGAAATFCRDRIDNSVFWLGQDERGQGIAWRNNGYTPQRISNHAVEQVWASYPRISDAQSYAFQMGGHTFWHIYFPSGLNDSGLPLGASWRYDAATQMWTEVAFWDQVAGRNTAHRSCNHAFAFGKHLVGDWNSVNLYEMAMPIANDGGWDFCDDFGNEIRRMRRAPHVSTEQRRMFIDQFQLHVETGIGPQPPLLGPDMGPPRAPSVIYLLDSDGVVWQVTIDDTGNFVRVGASSASDFLGFGADGFGVSFGGIATGGASTPDFLGFGADGYGVSFGGIASGVTSFETPLILNDNAAIPTTSWGLGITTGGNLIVTQVPFKATYPQTFPMASTPGNHPTAIFVQLAAGVGLLQTATPNQSRDPQVCLRWSKDNGHTWSNERWRGVGQAGKFMKRVIWRRLGWAWDWVPEITMSDRVPWRIVDAYLDASPNFQPTERLVHQLRKGA